VSTLSSCLLATPSVKDMTVSELADRCEREICNYRNGEAHDQRYCVELFRRVTVEHDPLAWELLQQRLNGTVLRWMYCHPKREIACRFDSEQNYVAQAFARFWQATVYRQQIEFSCLAAALRYLRTSLNGAILDTLRAYSRPNEVPLPEPDKPGEPLVEDVSEPSDVKEIIERMLSDVHEQRVAYLLFYCGLKPREIVQAYPQDFNRVQEIYRVRRNIMDKLQRNATYISQRLQ